MSILGSLTRKDMDSDKLFFTKDEVTEFVCTDFTFQRDAGTIMLRTLVQTGEHTGKKHTIFIPDDKTEINRKKRATFFFASGFWSEEELIAAERDDGDLELKRLINRKFSAKPSNVREKDGKKYQDMNDIRDLGPVEVTPDSSPGAEAAAATQF